MNVELCFPPGVLTSDHPFSAAGIGYDADDLGTHFVRGEDGLDCPAVEQARRADGQFEAWWRALKPREKDEALAHDGQHGAWAEHLQPPDGGAR